MKCKHKYKSKLYKDKSCPYDALPNSDYCIWHRKKDGKDFSGKEIQETDLVEAYLVGAIFNGKSLKNINFYGANLKGAHFCDNTKILNSNLSRATLSDADLKGAKLSNIDLQGAKLRDAKLQGAYLNNVKLQQAILRSAHLEGATLHNTHLQGANLRSAHLQCAKLRNAEFENAKCMNSEFQQCNLRDSNFQGANLRSAHLQCANLRNAEFENADLHGADFKWAILYDADFKEAKVSHSDLRGAFLYNAFIKDARGLEYAKIGNMYIEEIIADNIIKILGINQGYKAALKAVLESPFKKMEIKENDFNFFISSSKIGYLETLNEVRTLYNKRTHVSKLYISQYRMRLYRRSNYVYVDLKNYFKNIGFYNESAKFFIGEYRAKGKYYRLLGDTSVYKLIEIILYRFRSWKSRKENKTNSSSKVKQETISILLRNIFRGYSAFIANRLLSITSLYGESIPRVFVTALSIILLYTGIYSLSGSVTGQNMAKPIHNFWTNLYFSIVTFTTLGYGDLHPVSSMRMRLLAGSEAFLGAFTIAYFVVVVSRKIMR